MNTDNNGLTTFVDGNPVGGGTGLAKTPVTKKQIELLRTRVGGSVQLKADRVLGVGRETVELISLDVEAGTAEVAISNWGTETVYLYMIVKLY